MKSVVLNLVVNATGQHGRRRRAVDRAVRQRGWRNWSFTTADAGWKPEVLENIFEPFFTRSRTGKGTGLGLFISHQIISQHDGTIEATSEGPGRGSMFMVRLPLQAAVGLPQPHAALAEAAPP